MTELIQLTDVQIAEVAGGVTRTGLTQTITFAASQRETSPLTQTATTTNSGTVTATSRGGLQG